jgi:hypothetical protein
VDEQGKFKISFTNQLDIPHSRLMVGTIEPKRVSSILTRMSRAGFFRKDLRSGLITAEGPSVVLLVRNDRTTNELQHVAVDDSRYRPQMNTPDKRRFSRMWNRVIAVLAPLECKKKRPLTIRDGVLTEVPWIRNPSSKRPPPRSAAPADIVPTNSAAQTHSGS